MLYTLLLFAQAEESLVFVGNSYTQYNNLPVQVQSTLEDHMRGWSDSSVSTLVGGGLTLANHANMMNNGGGNWSQTLSREQDWFILQDQSQIPGFPETETYWQDSLTGLQQLHTQVSEMNAKSMLMLTWGRRDGDPQNEVLYADFMTMQERLNDGYLSYAAQAGSVDNPIYVAPVGPVFAHVHQNTNEHFARLYASDGSHPSALGSTVASLAITASLTGRTVNVSDFDLSAEDQAWVFDAVHSTVLEEAVGIYPLPWLWSVIPDNGEIVHETMRPLLRIRVDQEQDLNIVDGRVWIENGRNLGDVTVQDGSELRIDGGSQVGTVDGNLELRSGRLRLTEVTGDVLQTGGEIWLDAEETTIGGYATITFLELHPDLDEATLYTGGMDVSNMELGEGLVWAEGLNNSISLVRLSEELDTADSNGDTEDTGVEKEETGCAGAGLWLLIPLFGWGHRPSRKSQSVIER